MNKRLLLPCSRKGRYAIYTAKASPAKKNRLCIFLQNETNLIIYITEAKTNPKKIR